MDQAQDKKTPLEKTVDDLLFIVLEGIEEEHGKELTYAEVTIRTDTRDGASRRVSRTGATAFRPMLTTEVALTDAQIKKLHADWERAHNAGTDHCASRTDSASSISIQTTPVSGATTMGMQDRITLTTGSRK